MTRETKIGLLVGLAFIVVFAVLLSHTGTVPPPGESPVAVVAHNSRPNTPLSNDGLSVDAVKTNPVEGNPLNPSNPAPVVNPLETAAPPVTTVVNNTTGSDSELPRPNIFDPPRVGTPVAVADADKSRGEVPEMPATIVGMHRTAPPVEPIKPEPTVRPVELVTSASPDGSKNAADPTGVMMATNNKTPEPTVAKQGKEYVVQSRDSLYKIAQKYYKSGSPRYVEAIVKANELKNANTVVEGQKLVIPELPADMFEGTKQFNGKLAGGKPKSLSLDELVQDIDSHKTNRTGSSKEKTATAKEDDSQSVKRVVGFEKVVPMVGSTPVDDSTLDLTSLDKPQSKTTGKTGTSDKTAKDANKSKGKEGRTAPAKEDKDGGKGGSKESKPSREKKEIGGSSAKMLASNKGKSNQKNGRGDDMFCWYEVKPNDTLTTIAKDSLGSSDRWKEIKKLNGDVDPQKMKTGTRIKIPSKAKPVSAGPERGRTSA